MTLLLRRKRPPKFLPNRGLVLPSSTLWIGALNAMSARASALRREVKRLNSLQIQLSAQGSARSRHNPFLRNRNLPKQQFYTPPNQPIVIHTVDRQEKKAAEPSVETPEQIHERLRRDFEERGRSYYRGREDERRRAHDTTMGDADSEAGAASRARGHGVPSADMPQAGSMPPGAGAGPSEAMPTRQESGGSTGTHRGPADARPTTGPEAAQNGAANPQAPAASNQPAIGVNVQQERVNSAANAPPPVPAGAPDEANPLAGGDVAPQAAPALRTQAAGPYAVQTNLPVRPDDEPMGEAFDQNASALGPGARAAARRRVRGHGQPGGGLPVQAAASALLAMDVEDHQAAAAEAGGNELMVIDDRQRMPKRPPRRRYTGIGKRTRRE